MSFDYLLSRFNLQEMTGAFVVLFAVIDVLGSTPIIINLKQQGRPVNALHATLISSALLVGFFFAGAPCSISSASTSSRLLSLEHLSFS